MADRNRTGARSRKPCRWPYRLTAGPLCCQARHALDPGGVPSTPRATRSEVGVLVTARRSGGRDRTALREARATAHVPADGYSGPPLGLYRRRLSLVGGLLRLCRVSAQGLGAPALPVERPRGLAGAALGRWLSLVVGQLTGGAGVEVPGSIPCALPYKTSMTPPTRPVKSLDGGRLVPGHPISVGCVTAGAAGLYGSYPPAGAASARTCGCEGSLPTRYPPGFRRSLTAWRSPRNLSLGGFGHPRPSRWADTCTDGRWATSPCKTIMTDPHRPVKSLDRVSRVRLRIRT